MLLGDGADETALHQIVGPRRIPRQGPRIAPQAGDFAFEKMGEIGHRVYPQKFRRRLGSGPLDVPGIKRSCNPLMYRHIRQVKCCLIR